MRTTDQIIYELELSRSGSNVHTVNKAIFYLRYFIAKQDDRLEAHSRNCCKALDDGRFDLLAYTMRRLW